MPGHWEGDSLSGPNNTYIATLVERQTRYVMLVKVAGKDTRTVVNALIKQAKKLPKELYKSLTWDRGKELTDHRRFTMATSIDGYFCDPQSPWQRGSNENTNGLLRQYFSKGHRLVGAFASPSEQSGSPAGTNGHVRPCNLRRQQRDLMPVLRRPVEPARQKKQTVERHALSISPFDCETHPLGHYTQLTSLLATVCSVGFTVFPSSLRSPEVEWAISHGLLEGSDRPDSRP